MDGRPASEAEELGGGVIHGCMMESVSLKDMGSLDHCVSIDSTLLLGHAPSGAGVVRFLGLLCFLCFSQAILRPLATSAPFDP